MDEVNAVTIDVKDRDPNHMNDHVRVSFHEIIGEPHSEIYSYDSVWINSHKIFTGTKRCCYRFTTFLCAVPLSVCWGINFALLACCTIWCYRPCSRAYNIELSCIREFWTTTLDALYRPCYEAFGYIFYNMRIKLIKSQQQEV